ncbi:hypothetical protein Tsubulata_028753 [Turnera subulata]|uniref:SHSP domain-containing protein n=1 Tax=Turnera subulata TaxID=218843 RepID=A0A9Q0FPG1_9ROSI|nr:hypothetical protein Tsubulata_028753 [Turnera subulata]
MVIQKQCTLMYLFTRSQKNITWSLDEVKAQFSGGMFIIRIPKINADEQQIASKEEEQATTSQATTPAPQEAAEKEAEPQKVEDKAPKKTRDGI